MPHPTKNSSRGRGKARAAVGYRTARVLQDVAEDEDAIFGVITKVYGFGRYLLTIPDPKDTRPLKQRRTIEVQASAGSGAGVVSKMLKRDARVGEYLVVAPSGSDYEIAVMLPRDRVQEYRKSGRIHPNLCIDISAPDDCGIEFDYEASAQTIEDEIKARKGHKNKSLARGIEESVAIALPSKAAAPAPLVAVDDDVDINNI